jgi:predicted GIY-YIG superfamily endonuclease
MTVYLIHLDQPMSRGVNGRGQALYAGHYIGYTNSVDRRMMEHASGRGARFLEVCRERGISFEVVRTWEGADRRFERRLKNYKKSKCLCPICNPNAENYMKLEVVL